MQWQLNTKDRVLISLEERLKEKGSYLWHSRRGRRGCSGRGDEQTSQNIKAECAQRARDNWKSYTKEGFYTHWNLFLMVMHHLLTSRLGRGQRTTDSPLNDEERMMQSAPPKERHEACPQAHVLHWVGQQSAFKLFHKMSQKNPTKLLGQSQ